MSTPRSEFIAGSKAVLPILIGVLPFALIAGVTAVSINMTTPQGIGMSLILYAGAAQLVAMQLIGLNIPILLTFLALMLATIKDWSMVAATIAAGITVILTQPYLAPRQFSDNT